MTTHSDLQTHNQHELRRMLGILKGTGGREPLPVQLPNFCWQYDEGERILAPHKFDLRSPVPDAPVVCIHCAALPPPTFDDPTLGWRQPLGILQAEAQSWLCIRSGFYRGVQQLRLPPGPVLQPDHDDTDDYMIAYSHLVVALYRGLAAAHAITGEFKSARVYAGSLASMRDLQRVDEVPTEWELFLSVENFKGTIIDNRHPDRSTGIQMRRVHYKSLTGYLIETPFINLYFNSRFLACGFGRWLGWHINTEGRWLGLGSPPKV